MKGRREEELSSPAENRLGTVIRAWRRFRQMSVTELAVQAGFGANGRGYISRIEHGRIRHLGDERLKSIAVALQLQSTDLLLFRMPEGHGETATHDLDEAIIGGIVLLKVCAERSLDWARLQLLLAKFYHERAILAQTTTAKYNALIAAQQCVQRSFLVFTITKAPQSFQEATQLDQEIGATLDSLIITSSQALLRRFSPQSFDWARIQLLRAKFYHKRAAVLQDLAARTALIRAQQCIEAALPVFTQKPAQRSLNEARQLYEEIMSTLKQLNNVKSTYGRSDTDQKDA